MAGVQHGWMVKEWKVMSDGWSVARSDWWGRQSSTYDWVVGLSGGWVARLCWLGVWGRWALEWSGGRVIGSEKLLWQKKRQAFRHLKRHGVDFGSSSGTQLGHLTFSSGSPFKR